MAVTYLAGHNVTFETVKYEEAAPKAAIEDTKARRIFLDEEHQGRGFRPFQQAEKPTWGTLFSIFNRLRLVN